MKIYAWKSLARGVILESVRRKDLWVVAILGLLIMLSSGALGFFGFQGLESFAKDLGVSVLGLFSTIIAVLTSARAMPEEVKNRTLYPLLARPISRFDLIFGKFLGCVAVAWISFLILAAMTAAALLVFKVRFEGIMLQYMLAKMLGLSVICAVSLCLSVFMTPAAAATLGLTFAFGSTMIVRALVMASAGSPGLTPVFKGINALIPQFGLFDLGSRVANTGWPMVPLWVMGALFAYAVVYGGVMVGFSWLKFRSQPI